MIHAQWHKLRTRTRAAGQALVEFALASTLIFLLLSAAFDLGMIFFSLQSLNNAAQEGAVYGAQNLLVTSGTGERFIDANEIRNRVRFEAGTTGARIVNLFDLNNNKVPDVEGFGGVLGAGLEGQSFDMEDGERVVDSFIRIEMLVEGESDGSGQTRLVPEEESAFLQNAGTDCLNQQVLGSSVIRTPRNCYVRVTVRYRYNVLFPFAPALGAKSSLPVRTSSR